MNTAENTRTINVIVGDKTEQIAVDGKVAKSETYFVDRFAQLPSAAVDCYCGKRLGVSEKPVICLHPDDERAVYELNVRGKQGETRKINVRGKFEEKQIGDNYR